MARYAERSHLYRWGAPERRLRTVRDRLMEDAEAAGSPLSESAGDTAYAAALDAALDGASAFADTYIAKAATLPLASWTDALRRHIAAIAAFDLVKNVGMNPNASEADAVLVVAHKEALRWLEQVAQGRVEPLWVDATPDDTEDVEGYAISDPPRRWSPYG